jgi:hypothetical protein
MTLVSKPVFGRVRENLIRGITMRSLRSFFLRGNHTPETALVQQTIHSPDRPPPPSWRGLYVAALLETDKGRIAQRIAEAEKALVVRARELFQTRGGNLEEESAIDDALYALHALEHCTGTDAHQYAQRRV